MTKPIIPCALLLNDMHVSKDCIAEFHNNWEEALDLCTQHHITDMFIGGDLWQSRSAQTLSTLLAVRSALLKANSLGIHVTIAEGNHCKVDQESLYGYSHIFDQYPNVSVVDVCDTYLFDNGAMALHVMSYFPENGSFVDYLNDVITSLDPQAINILYMHEGINGALSTPVPNELPTHIFSDFDKVLVGHYHNRCKVAKSNVEYIGSSRQHNFGEDEEKGYTLLYPNGATQFIQNNANVRYATLHASADDLQQCLHDANDLLNDTLYQVKIKISCQTKDAAQIDRAALLDAGIAKIDIVSTEIVTTHSEVDLETKFDKSGVIQEYTGFCEQKSIPYPELGLSYLHKIK